MLIIDDGPVVWFVVGGWALVDLPCASFWGVGCLFSTESLILAQDERWRRA